MYRIPKEWELKDTTTFAYSNRLSLASEADAEVGGKDNALPIERIMTDVRNEDNGNVQVCIFPYEYQRRATYLLSFDFIYSFI